MYLILDFKRAYKPYKRAVKEMNQSLGLKIKYFTKKDTGRTYAYYYHLVERSSEEKAELRKQKKLGFFKGNVNFKDKYIGKDAPEELHIDEIKELEYEGRIKWEKNHLVADSMETLNAIIHLIPETETLETINLTNLIGGMTNEN